MRTLVMKFGGSTVGTTRTLTQALDIVLEAAQRWDRLVLVVAALDGITDALIEAAHFAHLGNSRGYRRIVATLRTRHLALIERLPLAPEERSALQADIDRLLFDLLTLYQGIADVLEDALSQARIDRVTSMGERLSARIFASLLRQNKLRGVSIDATDLIITDAVFGNAKPDLSRTAERVVSTLLPMMERGIVPVLTGFIGGTVDGRQTTLGRGGSDYSAAVIAASLQADEVWMWTDVDGVMSADPAQVPGAAVIPALSYAEMAELSYFGARLVHPRMVGTLRSHEIPLRIRNIYHTESPGTLVSATARSNPQIKAATAIRGIGLAAERSGSIAQIAALVDEVLFNAASSRAEVMISAQSSAHSFMAFVIPTSISPDAAQSIEVNLRARLRSEALDLTWTVHPVSIVTAIGAGLDGYSGLSADVLRTLQGIRVFGLAQGPSWCSLSVVVTPGDADVVLHQIHQLTNVNDASAF